MPVVDVIDRVFVAIAPGVFAASAASCYGAFRRQSGHPVAGSAPARS